MNKYRIRVTQLLSGFYEADLEIEAKTKKEALEIISNMSKEEIDESVNWSQGWEFEGDVNTIEYYKDTLYKL